MLRLKHIQPGSMLCFLFFEVSIFVGVLLAFAELVPWWVAVLLPVTVAVMVKLNDVIAGAIANPVDDQATADVEPEPLDDAVRDEAHYVEVAGGNDGPYAVHELDDADLTVAPADGVVPDPAAVSEGTGPEKRESADFGPDHTGPAEAGSEEAGSEEAGSEQAAAERAGATSAETTAATTDGEAGR